MAQGLRCRVERNGVVRVRPGLQVICRDAQEGDIIDIHYDDNDPTKSSWAPAEASVAEFLEIPRRLTDDNEAPSARYVRYLVTPSGQLIDLPEDGTDPLSRLPRGIGEILEALALDIREKPSVHRRVRWDESGEWLLVDSKLFGAYGIMVSTVEAAIKRAKLGEKGRGSLFRIVEPLGRLLLPH